MHLVAMDYHGLCFTYGLHTQKHAQLWLPRGPCPWPFCRNGSHQTIHAPFLDCDSCARCTLTAKSSLGWPPNRRPVWSKNWVPPWYLWPIWTVWTVDFSENSGSQRFQSQPWLGVKPLVNSNIWRSYCAGSDQNLRETCLGDVKGC